MHRAFIFFLSMGLLAACAPARYDQPLAWAFIDGRDCAGAGVELVQVRIEEVGPVENVPCGAGQGERRVLLRQLAVGAELDLSAVSAAGGVLYRGAAELCEPPPAVLMVTLRYTGGL